MEFSELVTWIFLVGGIVLMASEAVLPGLVAIFVGAAAVITAGLRFMGVLESLPISLLVWISTSVLLVAALRSLVKKWLPADETVGETDEAVDAYGQIVDVVKDCPEYDDGASPGRIRFDGTTWPAFSTDGVVRGGQKARLMVRENLTWYVEGVVALDESTEEPVPALTQSSKQEEK